MYNTALYILTVLIWGSTWLAIKFQVGNVPVIQSVCYRFAIAAIITQLILLITNRYRKYNFQNHIWFFMLGLFLFALEYSFIYAGTATGITTGLVAVIFSLIMPMNILNNRIFNKEKTEGKIIFGEIIGILGILLLFIKLASQ